MLRAGDCVRWPRNGVGARLVEDRPEDVVKVSNGRVTLRSDGGTISALGIWDHPQPRHLDQAWNSAACAFQRSGVGNAAAATGVRHPSHTTQKLSCVEIGRAQEHAVPATDDAVELRAWPQAAAEADDRVGRQPERGR
ncbi:MAG: hypothetical protein OXJ64_08760 [Boseongicola sp.]|nr:hypothetical protein [Boseongicola sp.]